MARILMAKDSFQKITFFPVAIIDQHNKAYLNTSIFIFHIGYTGILDSVTKFLQAIAPSVMIQFSCDVTSIYAWVSTITPIQCNDEYLRCYSDFF